MPDYHLYQIRNDRKGEGSDPGASVAYDLGRVGQIATVLAMEMHVFAAVVRARDLEDLFHKTSPMTVDWMSGPKVLQVAQGARPTGVGDIAVDPEAGDAWLCATWGWEALSWDRSERFLVDAAKRADPEARRIGEEAPVPSW
jgi:hypothetical protein